MLNLKPGSLRQRIIDVFGKQYGQDLLPVEADTVMCRVTGFVSKPESARKKGGNDYFFVNGRYMKHPYFHKAVMTVYERLIPEGMQPPYFLYFEINPSDIDGDGFIGPGDFALLSAAWFASDGDGNYDPRPDVDGDGFAGPGDFTYRSANWFKDSDSEDSFYPPV